jgi:hypothetical protein
MCPAARLFTDDLGPDLERTLPESPEVRWRFLDGLVAATKEALDYKVEPRIEVRDAEGAVGALSVAEAQREVESRGASMNTFAAHFSVFAGRGRHGSGSISIDFVMEHYEFRISGRDESVVLGAGAVLRKAMERLVVEAQSPQAPAAPTSPPRWRRFLTNGWTITIVGGLILIGVVALVTNL